MTNQSELNIFSPEIKEKTYEYLKFLLEYNQKVNLTAIKDYQEAINKHLIDSLSATLWPGWLGVKLVADIGSGPGLPGIPLAIHYPEKKFILIESNGKKAEFLRNVIAEFGIENTDVIQDRAEEVGRTTDYRGRFDLALSRAVGTLPVLLELGVPFLRSYGHLMAYKGPQLSEEILLAKAAQRELKASDPVVISYSLPQNMGERHLAVYQKTGETSVKYPRRPGIPEKKPIK